MTPLHAPTIKGYYMGLLCRPLSCACFLIWIANINCMLYATWLVLPPYEYLWVQAGLGLLHMVVSHIELVWMPEATSAHEPRKELH